MISTKSVVASSAQRTVCTGFAAFFEHDLNLGHGSIVWQTGLIASQGFVNLVKGLKGTLPFNRCSAVHK
jgi:hypothetical protein